MHRRSGPRLAARGVRSRRGRSFNAGGGGRRRRRRRFADLRRPTRLRPDGVVALWPLTRARPARTEHTRNIKCANASPIRRADRGSRPKRLRQGRLGSLPSRRAAHAGVSASPRAQPPSQGARPQRAGQVPKVRKERTRCGFDKVAPAERVSRRVLARRDFAAARDPPFAVSRPMLYAHTSKDFATSLESRLGEAVHKHEGGT
jgi:hypothetical protein